MSPVRAEAHAEDSRSALTRRSARSYLRPYIAAGHRTRPSAQLQIYLSSEPLVRHRPLLPAEPKGSKSTHTNLRRANIDQSLDI